eukprot:CAMPEP_0179252408 /NCGR_PEP_ID=MMETSP0797-20121207/22201_1 /TAXON_ID=47934 /ORGANISM="Dinophysis acuminata, Strain DAEP01" /LENGTH=562 /DNA_ID=CAMNT_0020960241 /DNA_START=76 /DNA_END=1764 /DNA_ORIENTATION=-
MADEDDVAQVGDGAVEDAGLLSGTIFYDPPQAINPNGYSKWPLDRFVQAAYDGDLELLEKMLDREDPINGYHADINAHLKDINALQAASLNGQLEAVEMLLSAKADPHIKACMPYGKDPKEGETARAMAEKFGWDDIVDVLRKSEERSSKGIYKKYGSNNNARLWPIHKPQGLDPEQEKRARNKHKSLVRPLPNKAERKFYGDMVFGVTHGYDEIGKPIKARGWQGTTGPMAGDTDDVAEADAPKALLAQEAPTTIGLLFPGQGSQYVKMMETGKKLAKGAEMLATAKQVLGYDIFEVCQSGPEAKLEQSEICQPAIYIASLIAVEKLRDTRPEAVERPGGVAGLSLGEFTALTVANVMTFETGLSLVKTRGEVMSEAAKSSPQAMLSVAGIEKSMMEELCAAVRTETNAVCQIATELFPKGCTCAGSTAAVEALKKKAEDSGAMQTKILKANGAFHTSYMMPAREKLEKALIAALPGMKPPTCDVYMNSSGKVLPAGSDPKLLIPLLCDELTSTVLWETCVKGMIAAGLDEFYEVGPMKQLKAMMKRIDQTTWGKTTNIEI